MSDDLRAKLDSIQRAGRERLAGAASAADVDALRHELLGRSGRLTAVLRQLGSVPADERRAIGQRANEVRDELRSGDLGARLREEAIDMSAPGRAIRVGHLHPVLTTMRDLREIFHAYGFEVFEGPEIETEEYNFELLNIPADHPARDLWDTLYVAEPGSVEAGV